MTQRKPGYYPKLRNYLMYKGPDWTGKEIAAKIVEERVKRGWSMDRLEIESGVNKHTISNIERGDTNTYVLNLVRLARAFEISVSDLVGE